MVELLEELCFSWRKLYTTLRAEGTTIIWILFDFRMERTNYSRVNIEILRNLRAVYFEI